MIKVGIVPNPLRNMRSDISRVAGFDDLMSCEFEHSCNTFTQKRIPHMPDMNGLMRIRSSSLKENRFPCGFSRSKISFLSFNTRNHFLSKVFASNGCVYIGSQGLKRKKKI